VLSIIFSHLPWYDLITIKQVSKKISKNTNYDDIILNWHSILKKGQPIEPAAVKFICKKVKEILFEEPNILQLQPPITICGDIHGQLFDLITLFNLGGPIPDTKYLFLGNYIDRGYHSVEVMTLLLTLKLKYPDSIFLLRGNHECRPLTQTYGFYDEIFTKYGNLELYPLFCEVFDMLPLTAVVDNKIFCVHSGLSPSVNTLDDIWSLDRNKDTPHEGIITDILWSDPEDIEEWAIAGRGPGYLFGEKVIDKFLHLNGLGMMTRSHQLVQDGYKFMFNKKLVSVWSAPNYCCRCENVAAIMDVDLEGQHSFQVYDAVPLDEKGSPLISPSPAQ